MKQLTPTSWNVDEDTGVIEFATPEDAKKAAAMFTMLSSEINKLQAQRAEVVATFEDGIKLAALHVSLQHPVWDNTGVPPHIILDILEQNILALRPDMNNGESTK